MVLTPQRSTSSVGLVDVIDRILDKGLVINADIQVSLVGVELLGVKVRAAIASFETAARYGLEFPGGISLDSPGYRAAQVGLENCPACAKQSSVEDLLNDGCPWCGWQSACSRQRALPDAAGKAGEEMTPASVIEAMITKRKDEVEGAGEG